MLGLEESVDIILWGNFLLKKQGFILLEISFRILLGFFPPEIGDIRSDSNLLKKELQRHELVSLLNFQYCKVQFHWA